MRLDDGIRPRWTFESRLVPVGDGLAGVNDFAPLLVRADNFARTRLPGIVRGDDVPGAIGVGDFELGIEDRAGVVLRQTHPAQPAGIPTITEHGPDGVFFGSEQ